MPEIQKLLKGIYETTKEQSSSRGETEFVYVSQQREVVFGNLPPILKELVKITEPTMNEDEVVEFRFGHLKPYERRPESYEFSADWKRLSLSQDTETAVQGFTFNIRVKGDRLRYETFPTCGISETRSNKHAEDVLKEANNDSFLKEFADSNFLLYEKQAFLLEELINIFTQEK